MATHISVVDAYTLSLIKSQPVGGFITVGGEAPAVDAAKAPTPTAEVEDDEATAKVVKAPAKRKAEPKATEGVETK